NGPDGGNEITGGTDVLSFGGISGVRDAEHYSFLTGVFLDANEPTGDGPDRLDFSAAALTETFSELSPALGQTFFIGDGLTPGGDHQVFHVPTGATRLALGFADGFAFTGMPGFYDDNGGAFTLDSVSVLLPPPPPPPPPTNHDPDCSAAQASVAMLWPPD